MDQLNSLTFQISALTRMVASVPRWLLVDIYIDIASSKTGSSTMSGVIMGNNLQILSSAGGNTLIIPWNGANNSVLNDSTHFTGLPARATYTIRWNGTVISGTPGNIFNPNPTDAIRGYSNVKLTINYIVMP